MSSNVLKSGLAAVGLVALALYSCGTTASSPSSTASGTSVAAAGTSEAGDGVSFEAAEEEERQPFDEDAARERAEELVAEDTYVGLGAAYGCSDDCSGHEAGWRYRAENGYQGSNPDSPSFEEGGRAFDEAVDERVDRMRDDYEAGGDQES